MNKESKPGAQHILVVDDDRLILEILEDVLTASGLFVTAIRDGKQALDLIREEHFDLVLTDIGMPNIDGWEIAKRSRAKQPRIPVILLTGWGTQFEEADLKAQGVDLVLSKPCDLGQILTAVEEVMDISANHSSRQRKSQ